MVNELDLLLMDVSGNLHIVIHNKILSIHVYSMIKDLFLFFDLMLKTEVNGLVR